MDGAEAENGILYEKIPGRIVQGGYRSKKYPPKLHKNHEKFHSETYFTRTGGAAVCMRVHNEQKSIENPVEMVKTVSDSTRLACTQMTRVL